MKIARKTQYNTGSETKKRQDEITKPAKGQDKQLRPFNKSILSSDSRNEDGCTEEYGGGVNVKRQSLTKKTLSQLNTKPFKSEGIVKAIRIKHETKYETKCEDSTVKASVCCGL